MGVFLPKNQLAHLTKVTNLGIMLSNSSHDSSNMSAQLRVRIRNNIDYVVGLVNQMRLFIHVAIIQHLDPDLYNVYGPTLK